MNAADAHPLTLTDLRRAVSSVTYRQLDYWIRSGYIDILVNAEGSGCPRRFSQQDIARLVVLDRIVQSGLFPGGVPGAIIRPIWQHLADDRWSDFLHVVSVDDDGWRADWAQPLGHDSWLTVDTRAR